MGTFLRFTRGLKRPKKDARQFFLALKKCDLAIVFSECRVVQSDGCGPSVGRQLLGSLEHFDSRKGGFFFSFKHLDLRVFSLALSTAAGLVGFTISQSHHFRK